MTDPDIVAEPDEIWNGGKKLKDLAADLAAARQRFPSEYEMGRGASDGTEQSFVFAWQSLRNDVDGYGRRLVENLADHGEAIQTVAQNYDANENVLADSFDGIADDEEAVWSQFEENEAARDESEAPPPPTPEHTSQPE